MAGFLFSFWSAFLMLVFNAAMAFSFDAGTRIFLLFLPRFCRRRRRRGRSRKRGEVLKCSFVRVAPFFSPVFGHFSPRESERHSFTTHAPRFCPLPRRPPRRINRWPSQCLPKCAALPSQKARLSKEKLPYSSVNIYSCNSLIQTCLNNFRIDSVRGKKCAKQALCICQARWITPFHNLI